jgi:hypothetical protein
MNQIETYRKILPPGTNPVGEGETGPFRKGSPLKFVEKLNLSDGGCGKRVLFPGLPLNKDDFMQGSDKLSPVSHLIIDINQRNS